MKKALVSICIILGVVAFGATSADATKPKEVTFCHAAGLADEPANWVTLTLPWVAAYGPAGHFNENGTTRAGHERDYLGECDVAETTTTVAETTTTVAETTTTVAETTTTVAETTTTVAETTTTAVPFVDIVLQTTPPVVETTAPATTQPAPKSLPSTGNETWIMAAIALLLTTVGGGALALTRRP